MNFLIVTNALGIGGIERSAQVFAEEIHKRDGHDVAFATRDVQGARAKFIARAGIRIFDLNEYSPEAIVDENDIHVVFLHCVPIDDFLPLKGKVLLVQEVIFQGCYSHEADVNIAISAALGYKIVLAIPEFRNLLVLYYPQDVHKWKSIKTDAGAFRARLGIKPETFLIGRIARPEPSKWDYIFIATARKILRQEKDVGFLLVGAPLLYRLVLWRYRNRITYCPPSSDDEFLGEVYNSLDVFFHSAQRGETFGNVIAEAMIFGKPILTHSTDFRTSRGVARFVDNSQIELVRHGENGFVAREPGEAAHYLQRLKEDPALRRRMGESNVQKVHREFAAEVVVSRFLDIVAGARKGQTGFATEEELKKRYADFFSFPNSPSAIFNFRSGVFKFVGRVYTIGRRLLRIILKFDLESIRWLIRDN